MILKQQEIAEQRQVVMAREKERSLEAKRRFLAEKEAHSVIVRQEMERKQHDRVNSILGVAQRKEEVMVKTANEREWQMMIRKEQEALRREEKQDNVQRIARAQEYKKKIIMDKIEYDSSKADSLRLEKERLFSSRATIRRDADRQKQKILESFEKMRRKGKLDPSILAQFGVRVPEAVQEDPENEANNQEEATYGETRNGAAGRRGSALVS